MRYPSWNEFLGKYPDDPRNAFQALCRLLFRNKFGIGDSLPYFYNHPGIETAPVQFGNDLIGFQSKFFTGDTINDTQANELIDSIRTARNNNSNLTKIILYTNSVFYFPKPDESSIKRQKKVEKAATDLGLDFEWMFGDNILDVVVRTPLAYDLFFDLNSKTAHLPISIRKHNERHFKNIDAVIHYKDQLIRIERGKYISVIKEQLAQKNNILIYGESGSGKTAIMKQYWESTEETNTAFLLLNASLFGSGSVNDLFHLDEDYTLAAFRDFFSGTENKLLFIDSAEKLLEQSNHLVFQILTEELAEKDGSLYLLAKQHL